ncbi:methyltransferase domain-containing protein [Acetobacterium malicum]|uniref:Methyltransferase domain-containing protein n=1 Tax=Acetobacterium malicum TaxID=52692 RepID=A0ABR6YU21_9FIRM|nr:class I SAM-dependent methyltransferase [Acetobacterium malicum]MBC3898689.1 methyltransferase domain-containing protein [Acetobacterium malicum]
MKYRESGMPPELMWDTFFNPIEVINKMGITSQIRILIDVGCGYGTFLLPIAEIVRSKVIGIDIDDAMIEICRNKINDRNSSKIELINGDICDDNTLNVLNNYKDEIDFITLFNILHCEEPVTLLKNSYNILNDDGRIAITHWIYEKTPRGPSIEIRPKPEMIIEWALKAGFALEKQVDLPPYHYGLVFIKKV